MSSDPKTDTVPFLRGRLAVIETAINDVRHDIRSLAGAWSLELRILDHLCGLEEHDTNIYCRTMQAMINCRKRFPSEIRALTLSLQRLQRERAEKMGALKRRLGN